VTSFWKWLFGTGCDGKAELDNRNLAQTKQLVESSSNRVSRALEHSDRLTDRLRQSREHLEQHLDELGERMQKLRKRAEERKN